MAEVGNLSVRLGLDSADFTGNLKLVNSSLRNLESQFKSATVGVDRFSNNLGDLQFKAGFLNEKLEHQTEVAEQLRRRFELLRQEQGSNSRATLDAETAYNRALTAMRRTENELNTLNHRIEAQQTSWGRLGQSLHDTGERMTNLGQKMQSAGMNIAMSFGTATTALASGFGLALKSAVDFEAQISNIKAVSGATVPEMEKLKNLAIDLGAKTKYSSLEAAQGIEELIKAGVSTKDILNDGLSGALSLATAGELDLADAAEIASTALNAFKADNLNVTEAANLLAGGANASATSVGELKFGLSQVSAVASGIGLSFKDTTTALSLFANNGLKGSDAGTSLKTMLNNLIPKSNDAIGTMMKLGIVTKNGSNAFFDSHGNIKKMSEIAGILQNSLKGLNAEQRQQYLYSMFGSDAIRAANVLYKEGSNGIKQMYQEMSKVTAAQVAAEKMNNFKGALENLKGSVETAEISLGTALIPIMQKLTGFIQILVNKFNDLSPTAQKFIAIGGVIATAFLGIVTAIGIVLAIVGSAISGFGALMGVFAPLATAIAEAGGVMSVLGGALTAITGPIGIAVAAIVGLGVAFVALYKHNETFRNKVTEIWIHIGEFLKNTMKFINDIVHDVMGSVSTFFSSQLGKIKDFWKENGESIMNIVSSYMKHVMDAVKSGIEIIKGVFQIVWPIISGVVKIAWGLIQATIKNALDIILGVIKIFVKVFQGDWKGAFDALIDIGKNMWNNFVGIFKSVNFKQIGKDIIQGLINGMKSIAGGVKDTVKNIADSITGTIMSVLDMHSPSRVTHKLGQHTVEGLTEGMKSKQKEAAEQAKKVAAEAKKSFESELRKINYNFQAGKLTFKSYVDALDDLKKEYAKVPEAIERVDKYIAVAREKNAKEAFKYDKTAYENKVKLNQMSLVEEEKYLEKMISKYKKGSDERKYFEEQAYQVKQQIHDKLIALNDDYLQKVKDTNRKLAEDEQKLTDEYNKALDDRTKSLYTFAGLFDEIQIKSDISGQQLLDNLKGQVTAFQDWSNNITTLSKRGIDEGLLKELQDMGPKAYAEIAALTTLTDEQLKQYQGLWKEKHSLAKDESTKELEGLKVETAKKIEELKSATSKQLDEYKIEWQTKIKEITTGTKNEFDVLKATLPDIGKNAIKGLMDGMKSMSGELMAQAQAIASSVQKTIASALNVPTVNIPSSSAVKTMTNSKSLGTSTNSITKEITNTNSNSFGNINVSISAKDVQEFNNVVDFFNKLPQTVKAY